MNLQNMKRSETTEQINLFNWAKRTESIVPELALLHHIPNEGKRNNGSILKAAGLKSGVPDISLPVPMGPFHGLYIELKFGKNKTTKAQEDFMELLKQQNFKTAVCYGAEEARDEILDYLTEPGRMPKKVCINACWIGGKCDGVPIQSRIFARKECAGCVHHNPSKAEQILRDNLKDIARDTAERILDYIFYISCNAEWNGKTVEETMEILNKSLANEVKNERLNVQQSAAVLTVAMDAYHRAKGE